MAPLGAGEGAERETAAGMHEIRDGGLRQPFREIAQPAPLQVGASRFALGTGLHGIGLTATIFAKLDLKLIREDIINQRISRHFPSFPVGRDRTIHA
jgi:hypothetical protein